MEINPIRVNPVRGYSQKEIKDKVAEIEKKSLEARNEFQNEKARFISQNPNPRHLSFKESLAELTGQPIPPSTPVEEDDDEGFVLSINN